MFFGQKKLIFLKNAVFSLLFISSVNSAAPQDAWLDRQQSLLEQGFAQVDQLDGLIERATDDLQRQNLEDQKQLLLDRLESGIQDFKAAQQPLLTVDEASSSTEIPLSLNGLDDQDSGIPLLDDVVVVPDSSIENEFMALQNRVDAAVSQVKADLDTFGRQFVVTGIPASSDDTQVAAFSQHSSAWQVNDNGKIQGGATTVIADKPIDADVWQVTRQQQNFGPDGKLNSTEQQYQVPVN